MIHRLDIRHYHFSENTSARRRAARTRTHGCCCVVRGRTSPVMSRMNAASASASASADLEMGGRGRSPLVPSSGAAVHL